MQIYNYIYKIKIMPNIRIILVLHKITRIYYIMIRDLKAFYVAIESNKVVCYDTNLLKFVNGLKQIEPDLKGYQYYNREFKKSNRIVFVNNKEKIYYLQKVI